MPIVIDRRLQQCTDAELRYIARRLFDLWALKGHMPQEKMPLTWRRDVARLREELDRRGVQLSLF